MRPLSHYSVLLLHLQKSRLEVSQTSMRLSRGGLLIRLVRQTSSVPGQGQTRRTLRAHYVVCTSIKSTPSRRRRFLRGYGVGNCIAGEDSDGLRQKFETEFAGSEERLYEYWPQGFRWTCCGTEGDQDIGCDHHGKGPTPCSCDFCQVGDQTLKLLEVLCGHGWLTVR